MTVAVLFVCAAAVLSISWTSPGSDWDADRSGASRRVPFLGPTWGFPGKALKQLKDAGPGQNDPEIGGFKQRDPLKSTLIRCTLGS